VTNARASVDPPTDPFESVPPPRTGHPVRPISKSLPPGVSPNIFEPGRPGTPSPFGRSPRQSTRQGPGQSSGQSTLPPPVPAVEPWPVKGPTLREQMRLQFLARQQTGRAPADEPPEEPEPDGSAGRGRRLLILAAVGVLVMIVAYLIPAWIMSGKVLPGTTVGGVDVAGLTASAAAERLTERLGGQADADIAVKVGDRRFSVSPIKAGLAFDVTGTVAQLPTGFPAPDDVLRAFTTETRLRPRITVNEAKLKEQVDLIAAEVDRPVYEGAVVFRGREPVVVPPRPGTRLDRAAAIAAIKNAYLNGNGPVELAVRAEPPTASVELLKQALPEARRALSGPITLVNGSRRAVLGVEAIAANLRFVPDGSGGMAARFDAREGIEGVEQELLDPATAPRDATFGIVNGRPTLVPGRSGKGVDTDALASAVVKALTEGGSRTIPVTLTTTRPRLDNTEAKRLGIKEKISAFTVRGACCTPRAVNVRRVAELVDGSIVRPGETFSLSGVVGRPDRARGFMIAPTIENGRWVNRVGGGISDFATALHHAVFHAGLKIVERAPNDFHVARYPLGLDAAFAYPDKDLRWRNDSKYGVFIHAVQAGGAVTVELWSTRRYDRVKVETSPRRDVKPFQTIVDDGPGCVATEGADGFTVAVTRVLYKDGAEVRRDEPVTTVYRPRPRVTCGGPTRAVSEQAAEQRSAEPDVLRPAQAD